MADVTFRLCLLGSTYSNLIVRTKNLVWVMTKKNKINQRLLDDNLSLIDPKSDNFNFELWAVKVSQQMKTALEEKA